jgi:glycosyltransferase involved in cell wall biosynthesis
MMAASGIRVLLDVSPIGSRPEARTGLARVSLDLASALALVPDIKLSTCAWGSVEASRQFQRVREEFPRLNGLAVKPGPVERAFLTASSLSRMHSRMATTVLHRCGQAINLCRNPLRGHDLTQFDVVHSTYARIPRIVRRQRRPAVITVHDLTPLKLPASLTSRQQVGITSRILRSIVPTDWVVCVSEHTRHDFLEHSSHPADRALVIHNGVNHEIFFPVRDRAILARTRSACGVGEAPFVLTLSSLSPHKNLALLAEVWPSIRRQCPDALLVVAGGAAAQSEEVRAIFARRGDTSSIRFTGFVSDETFRALASTCQAFVFPSLYEGFGLPILEAMACGAPVICSDATSLPEVAGSAAALIDPNDASAWEKPVAEKLSAPLRDLPHADSIARAGEFSWSVCAWEHARLFATLARSG